MPELTMNRQYLVGLSDRSAEIHAMLSATPGKQNAYAIDKAIAEEDTTDITPLVTYFSGIESPLQQYAVWLKMTQQIKNANSKAWAEAAVERGRELKSQETVLVGSEEELIAELKKIKVMWDAVQMAWPYMSPDVDISDIPAPAKTATLFSAKSLTNSLMNDSISLLYVIPYNFSQSSNDFSVLFG